MERKYRLATLGCKVNQYESQQLREVIESRGLRPARTGEHADLAIVNTCAVTAEAVRENRRLVRKVSAEGRTPVFVVGCGAAADADRLSRLEGVAAVVGHAADAVAELQSFLTQRIPDSSSDVGEARASRRTPDRGVTGTGLGPSDPHAPRASESIFSRPLPVVKPDSVFLGSIRSFAGHQRAFVKVQDGCDAHCTYCIIPSLRGNPRFKPPEAVADEARTLVRSGFREIVLTGIYLGAYGRPTAIRRQFDRATSPLAELVRKVAAINGLDRLRLSSLEPGDVDDALLAVMVEHQSCVPHLHLPLQSGSPRVLRRMNRQYSRDDFLRVVDRVRATLDRPAITTDILVGFPGETEEDFRDSMKVARAAQFCKIHAFPFSPREGTAAARWTDAFVPPAVVRERARRLAELDQELSIRFRRQFIGELERVVVEPIREEPDVIGKPRIRHGRCDRYFDVQFEADESVSTGELVTIRIEQITPRATTGTLVRGLRRGLRLPVLV